MKRFSAKKMALVALVVLFSIGVFGVAVHRGRASRNQYFTAIAETGSLSTVVNATGTVQAVVTVNVGSQISGQVAELYADFNSVVKRGQLLAKLDARAFESQVENSRANVAAAGARVRSAEADEKTQAANLLNAKANLEAARVGSENAALQFKRAAELSKRSLIPQNDYDSAQANANSAHAKYEQAQAAVAQADAQTKGSAAQFEQARAQLEQAQADLNRARLNLEYCNIFSPVDGVVISRNVDVGQTIAASMQAPTLFIIANDLTRMQVNAAIDEADIGNVSDRADVRFTVDAYPNETFQGRIAEIRLNPQTVQNVVTYNVIVDIENPELKLKPGMTANITMTVEQREQALKIANAALRYSPSGKPRLEWESPPLGTSNSSVMKHADGSSRGGDTAPPRVLLAPGQKWNPLEKVRTAMPRRPVERPSVVYVLNAERKPEARRVVLGITDGSSTEVVAGELRDGDAVIIGDALHTTATSGQTNASRLPSSVQGVHDMIMGGRGRGGN